MIKNKYLKLLFLGLIIFTLPKCSNFDEMNENPNEPLSVSADVILPSAIRKSVNTSVNGSYLVGNIAAQLASKTLRLEVDAYNWNAFPQVWEGLYESLTDLEAAEEIAINQDNNALLGAVKTYKSWIFLTLTNAYGNIPFSEALDGQNDVFTPKYDNQQAIYTQLLTELEEANTLLQQGGSVDGDILLNGNTELWRKFANSLRLRMLMYAGDKISDAGSQFKSIVDNEPILTSNADNITLTYTGNTPNEFPIIPLKQGDFDAVAFSNTALQVMQPINDPRLLRYARPNNEQFDSTAIITGDINGSGPCDSLSGSRLGVQYYNYPGLITAENLGLPMAEGIIMTFSEVSFTLAEAAVKGWISDDPEMHYRAGIEASMNYHQVDLEGFGLSSFDEYYNQPGVAYSTATDIWKQKWLALFFHGLEPYFEVRRWYAESGNSFDGIPFLSAACGNLNNDQLPLRFLYPGEEQSLNAQNYQNAVDEIGGSNSQNASMWIVE